MLGLILLGLHSANHIQGFLLQSLQLRRNKKWVKAESFEEWNTLQRPHRSQFIKLLEQDVFANHYSQFHFVSLAELDGITACARAGATVGLFAHTKRSQFLPFVKRLELEFAKETLVFIHFPLGQDEKIQGACLRKIAGSGGYSANTVLIVSQMLLRIVG